jgi:hypothetical protein
MAQQTVNNLEPGLSARTKINENFTELYTDSIQSVTSAATVTALSTNDYVNITAQAEALTIANPTGTPDNFAIIAYRIKDNGTARAISFGSQFRAVGVTLPTTTVLGKIMYIVTIWHAGDSKWDVVNVIQEA